MSKSFHPIPHSTNPKVRDYQVALLGTAALVAVNIVLSLPLDAALGPDREPSLVETGISGANLIDDGKGSDDVATELAATPVANKQLSKLRGGFTTVAGMEILVGFDFQTFLNGQLRVHNIFSLAGDGPPTRSAGPPSTRPIQTVTINSGGHSTTFESSVPVTVSSGEIPDVASIATNNSNKGSSPPSSSGTPATPTVDPIVVDQVTKGNVTVVNEISPGTRVINRLDGGRANTIIENMADGISIQQITSMTVSLKNPANILSTVKSGRFQGIGHDVSNGWRSALIGAIAR